MIDKNYNNIKNKYKIKKELFPSKFKLCPDLNSLYQN
jgi:hypothetical protein